MFLFCDIIALFLQKYIVFGQSFLKNAFLHHFFAQIVEKSFVFQFFYIGTQLATY